MGRAAVGLVGVLLVAAGGWLPVMDGPGGMLLVGSGLLLGAAQGRSLLARRAEP